MSKESGAIHFSLDQDRLQAVGLTSSGVFQLLGFLLTGVPITSVREDIRSVQVVGRAAGEVRLDPAKIGDFTLIGLAGQRVTLSQIVEVSVRIEDPILRHRDRHPTITVRENIAEGLQHPDVSTAVWKDLQPIVETLPAGYNIEMAGALEESGKASQAIMPLLPILIAPTLLIIILQVRSISAIIMVFLTSPQGLIGVVPILVIFGQPFGINALVGLIALSEILMRNTLILIGQIHANEHEPLDPFSCCRGHIAAGEISIAHCACSHPGIHPADSLGVLGHFSLHADRRYVRRHDHDPGIPARDVLHLVQNPSSAAQRAKLNLATVLPLQDNALIPWILRGIFMNTTRKVIDGCFINRLLESAFRSRKRFK